MSDKIIVLSKIPTIVKITHNIDLVPEVEKTPFKVRKLPQFQDYFNILLKELYILNQTITIHKDI